MYKAGRVIKFDYEHDGIVEKDHWFILADCHEKDFVFQIVCIKGYHSGTLEGYIKKENKNSVYISKEHLISELNRNFIKIHWDTFDDAVKWKTRSRAFSAAQCV